jgi:hypothetical protein
MGAGEYTMISKSELYDLQNRNENLQDVLARLLKAECVLQDTGASCDNIIEIAEAFINHLTEERNDHYEAYFQD